MLIHLHIENYALIQTLDLNFQKGLTVITGETGAGKSILLGALSLIIGKKLENYAFLQEDKKCIVEGVFDISNLNLNDFFTANDLDFQHQTIIRREMVAGGKSRAFVNDSPVSLPVLASLGEYLIDIHSQHQTLWLKNDDFRLQLIDGFAQNAELLQNYKTLYKEYKSLQKKSEELKTLENRQSQEQDYLSFLYEEFEKAALKNGEQEEAEQELKVLNSIESIKTVLNLSQHILEEDEFQVIGQLITLKNHWASIAEYNEDFKVIFKRLDSALIELKDISTEIYSKNDVLEYRPERMEQLQNRLDLIYRLQQKHQVQTVSELLQKQTQLQEGLSGFLNLKDMIAENENALKIVFERLVNAEILLSQSRIAAAENLSQDITQKLAELNMPKAHFKIAVEKQNDLTVSGSDKLMFLFSANSGQDLAEIKQVASGGEMSRLMLALKSAVCIRLQLPTVIFDEIDTGISGQTAAKVGKLMQKTAQNIQLIAITHLPQIASVGETHLSVSKQLNFTMVRVLNHEERVQEIASMLSGEQLSKSAVETAKELLKS